jgi:hypothetical protein
VRSPSLRDALVQTDLCFKEWDDDCNVFFTRQGNVYHFYDGFLQRILLWARYPGSMGKEGLIGSQFSIGPSREHDAAFDMHATRYDHREAVLGRFKTVVPSMRRRTYRCLERQRCHLPDASEYLQYLWDAFCDGAEGQERDGSDDQPRVAGIQPLMRGPRRCNLFSRRTPPTPLRPIDQKRLRAMLSKRLHGCVRIPYVQKKDLACVARALRDLDPRSDTELQLFSHHAVPCAFVWFLPRP